MFLILINLPSIHISIRVSDLDGTYKYSIYPLSHVFFIIWENEDAQTGKLSHRYLFYFDNAGLTVYLSWLN